MSAGRTLAGFRKAPKYLCMAALLALCGCSGGPSSSDIQTALQEASDAVFGRQMATVEKISDVDCKEAQGKPGFICAFNATSFSKLMNSRSSQVGEARFVQQGSKWVAMNDK